MKRFKTITKKTLAILLSTAMIISMMFALIVFKASAEAMELKLVFTPENKFAEAGDEVKITVSIDGIARDEEVTLAGYQIAVPAKTDQYEIMSQEGSYGLEPVGENFLTNEILGGVYDYWQVKGMIPSDNEAMWLGTYFTAEPVADNFDLFSFYIKLDSDLSNGAKIDINPSKFIITLAFIAGSERFEQDYTARPVYDIVIVGGTIIIYKLGNADLSGIDDDKYPGEEQTVDVNDIITIRDHIFNKKRIRSNTIQFKLADCATDGNGKGVLDINDIIAVRDDIFKKKTLGSIEIDIENMELK